MNDILTNSCVFRVTMSSTQSDVKKVAETAEHPGGSQAVTESSKEVQKVPSEGVRDKSSVTKGGSKRKSSPGRKGKSLVKRSRSNDFVETGALKRFGHLVHQGPQKAVRHSLGKIAIPDEQDDDSEFEEVMFSQETRVTLWDSYVSLMNDILEESTLSDPEKMNIKALHEMYEDKDFPAICPIDTCGRMKPVYSRLGLLRHLVERHMPLRPMWRCPYGKGKCRDAQPRKIAHVRHVGWTHGRPYCQAAAHTYMEDLSFLEKNKRFDTGFKVRGMMAGRYNAKVKESNPDSDISPPSSFKRIIITSDSSEEELGDLPCCALEDEEIEVFVSSVGAELLDSVINQLEGNDETLEATTTLERVLSEMDAPTLPSGPQVSQAPCPVMEAKATLPQPELKASEGEARELKPIPELFRFVASGSRQFLDPRTGEVEHMKLQIRSLQTTCMTQMKACEELVGSLKVVSRLADEHEGNLKQTEIHLEEVIQLRRDLYKAKQMNTELTWRASVREKKLQELEVVVLEKTRSVGLLEDHVKTLQHDVQRLKEDNAEAESQIIDLKKTSDDSGKDQIDKMAAQFVHFMKTQH